ncbi:Tyrosine recombinase XerD [Pontiella desulfatans]|uniref:Tyrosine recombinase XerD n=1 Tax=Pontiella desulfatans TaxID=2750659 RepID=A0A6C2UCP7_PONDE|nr:tyrosine-type recombinase/integrase [Pontiella desulfatans]VGO13403.1 Tyrosine recombinase XerD [Pontiella desulfatans]VGO14096.1 Tyrosine recombinase XerD [Pontiella desulfatans]VGO15116.1 Tyrosine recombinase XerD [Pontiella desulfatans]VGO17679.1 Tyrosine recombinase XerD [Pontiella desulfatans]
MNALTLPALVQLFFTDRLTIQINASPNTIASYRDTFRLLLRFAGEQHGKVPTKLRVEDLDTELVGDFLAYVENKRRNCARSRNARLAAIRSFFKFVAMTEPAYLLQCQRILSMPSKRHEQRTVEFLDRREMDALLSAPDRSTWIGQRDHAILTLALQTGLRASELINLCQCDLIAGTGAHVQCMGKGRKQRLTPLRKETLLVMKNWLRRYGGTEDGPLFPTIRGGKLSRDALEHLVRKHTLTASKTCPSLATKRVSPHVLRHSTAMELLHHGVDQTVISLWLGHESVETTRIYLHADLHLKEKALEKVMATASKPGRYLPADKLLAFLEGL